MYGIFLFVHSAKHVCVLVQLDAKLIIGLESCFSATSSKFCSKRPLLRTQLANA